MASDLYIMHNCMGVVCYRLMLYMGRLKESITYNYCNNYMYKGMHGENLTFHILCVEWTNLLHTLQYIQSFDWPEMKQKFYYL